MAPKAINNLIEELDNLKHNLSGRHIQIAGSAHETTNPQILKYSHELIRCIVFSLLEAGAKLIVATGAEDMVDPDNPSWETGLYYDWDVLETIGNYINSEFSNNPLKDGPLAMIVSSEKAESEIPARRRSLWDELIQKQAVYLERMPPGWNAGAFRREREAQYGSGLVVVGGGEGVEHLAQLYMESRKPIIPINLPIPSRRGDGIGGSLYLSRSALANPVEFIGPVDNGTTRLVGISTKNGKAPIEQICPKIIQLLAEAVAISEKKKMEQTEKNPKKVFVVHGRNDELRRGMFLFLRSIGLEPIEWTEAVKLTGSGSPYVGEILNSAFNHAQAVVVLLTPDDEARLRPEFQSESNPEYEKNFTPQVRQNVIFEAGMALGRYPDRTILVEVGNLRPFSDVAGRHTIRLDDTTEKRQALAMRLQAAGCKVNLDGTDWHKTGNFQLNS